MSNVYFISDLHFGHKNIIAYDNRPFLTTEEHDKTLIRLWNETINDEDTVYILGDFCFKGAPYWEEILSQLKGHKILIKGNHDNQKTLIRVKDYFEEITAYKEILYKGNMIVLSHYPIPCFRNHYYGEYHFYGHVHNSFEYRMMLYNRRLMEDLYSIPCNMYNVGAMLDYMNYRPRTFEEIVEGFEKYNHLNRMEEFDAKTH